MKFKTFCLFVIPLLAASSFTWAEDDYYRKGFGILSSQIIENGTINLDCRYYVAASGTNLDHVMVSIRAYHRRPTAHIESGTLELQAKSRALSNYAYKGYEWSLTNNDYVSTAEPGGGFSSIKFPGGNEIIADVSDAIQTQLSDSGIGPRLLLNLSVRVVTDKKTDWFGRPIVAIDHSSGVQTIDVTSVPFYRPEVYNKTADYFPMIVPHSQIASFLTDGKATQILGTLDSRQQATSHGLRYENGPEAAYFDLNLFRVCKAIELKNH